MTKGSAAKGSDEKLCHHISHQGTLDFTQTAILTRLVDHNGGL